MRIYCHVPVCFRLRIRFARDMERPRSSHDDGGAAIDARPYEVSPTLGEVYSPFKLTPLTLGAWSAAHAPHYSTLVRNLYLPDRQNWRQGSVESKPFAHAHGGSLADHMPSLT